MSRAAPRWVKLLVGATAVLSACSSAAGSERRADPASTPAAAPTTAAPTTAAPTATVPLAEVPVRTSPPAPPGRAVVDEPYTPFATAGGVTLVNPSRRVERVGFHQSNHEGAQQLEVLPTAIAPVTMETRDRLTSDRTAADVVSDPDLEVRAPVTGTVLAANAYTLYCKYEDDIVLIEPDDHPGWQVKVLHIEGLAVAPGDRVTAGETVIASNPRSFPFESDVDAYRTADPAWPHVHLEIIDPSIPNVPNPGSGGC